MLRILYLVHDLADPAVKRRVTMLEAGGASVVVAGFCRDPQAAPTFGGAAPVNLGRTYDGRFVQRLAAIGRVAVRISSSLGNQQRPDIIIARNLEMLALARRVARVQGGNDIPTVYE